MRLIVDAQLPRTLSDLLKSGGHDSIHTSELPLGNKTPDEKICPLWNSPSNPRFLSKSTERQ